MFIKVGNIQVKLPMWGVLATGVIVDHIYANYCKKRVINQIIKAQHK